MRYKVEHFQNTSWICLLSIVVEKMQKEGSAGKNGLERKESSLGGFGIRSGSAKEKKPLEGATTKFFVGTEVSE